MKTLLISLAFALVTCTGFASNGYSPIYKTDYQSDTIIKLKTDSNRNVYYQNIIKVDKSITVDLVYSKVVQFMAAKNIVQNYGYQQEGKLIFTTSQDLNLNPNYVGDDGDIVQPYTAQFAIIIDLKPGSYRFTVNNVVFYYPTQNGNKRETLLDVYVKATDTNSKRIARNGQYIIAAFERFLTTFTYELKQGVEQKAVIYSKF
jgi:hypothetical protein